MTQEDKHAFFTFKDGEYVHGMTTSEEAAIQGFGLLGVDAIPINLDDRYVIHLQVDHSVWARVPPHSLDTLTKQVAQFLREWWASEEKFCVLLTSDEMMLSFVRAESAEKAE